MTGTALTHPLDTIRLRLALPNHGYTGISNAFYTVATKEGVGALYKGLIPTLAGIAPYAAINFASYDMAKKMYYGEGGKQDPISNLIVGGASGTFSATVCYPLDTIRRRMQMKGKTYNGMGDAFATIWRKEGMGGFFKAGLYKLNSVELPCFPLRTLLSAYGHRVQRKQLERTLEL
jgi:solute carrier family 25 phosphate transporter 23/24/25/41